MYDIGVYRFGIYPDVNASINMPKKVRGLCPKLRLEIYDLYSTTASCIAEPRTYFADAEEASTFK